MVKYKGTTRAKNNVNKFKAQAKLIKPYVIFKIPKKPSAAVKRKVQKYYQKIKFYKSHGFIIYKPKNLKSKKAKTKLKLAQKLGKNTLPALKVAFISKGGQTKAKIAFKKNKAFLKSNSTETYYVILTEADKNLLVAGFESEEDLQPYVNAIIKRELGQLKPKSKCQLMIKTQLVAGMLPEERLGEEISEYFMYGISGMNVDNFLIDGWVRYQRRGKHAKKTRLRSRRLRN